MFGSQVRSLVLQVTQVGMGRQALVGQTNFLSNVMPSVHICRQKGQFVLIDRLEGWISILSADWVRPFDAAASYHETARP
jgi:hypothetical protein